MGDRVGSGNLMELVGDLFELDESLRGEDENSPGCSDISAVDLALADLEISTGCSKFSAVDLALAELACCLDE